jgi:hypothetical protein
MEKIEIYCVCKLNSPDKRKMKKQKTFNQVLDYILQVLDAEIKKKEY